MRVLRGKVVSGVVVVEGRLEEGARVTVLVPEEEHPVASRRQREDRFRDETELLRDLGGEG
jgi:hypothetical protein